MTYKKISDTLSEYEKLLDTSAGTAVMDGEGLQTEKTSEQAPPPAAASSEPASTPDNTVKAGLQTKRLIDIMHTEYAELIQPVERLICEGLTVFAGQSKIGKSRIIHLMCMAVAAGEPFLGRKTMPGSVLYMALEDGERRLQKRTAEYTELTGLSLSENLHIITKSPTAKDGLIAHLQGWIDEHKPVSMIVIDTLQKVRGITGGRANVYETDSEFMSQFKELADKNHVAVVMCHHLNKSKDSGDKFDRISGSTGIMGIADTAIILSRDRGKDTGMIEYTGRDVWGDDISLTFIDGLWQLRTPFDANKMARQLHDANPVVRLIRDIYQECPSGYRRTYDALLKESMTRYRVPISMTSKALSLELNRLSENLLNYDGLSVKTGLNFGKSKGIEVMPVIFYTEPVTEQTEQLSIDET